MRRFPNLLLWGPTLLAALSLSIPVDAESPYVFLGPVHDLGFSQPLVDVEVRTSAGDRLGPTTSNRFLLDTGANGILIASEALGELRSKGYTNEGTILEKGVAGSVRFDVSAEYDFHYQDAVGSRLAIPDSRLMSSASASFCQLGLCPFYGIAGMPAMADHVVSIDLTTGSIFDALGLGEGLRTTFLNQIPSGNHQRFDIPLISTQFEPDSDGPDPSWVDLPGLMVDPIHQGTRQTGNFILDTGAQVSLMSSHLARKIGLDANGNGSFLDEAVSSVDIGGIGGIVSAPQLYVDELRIPTHQGVDLVLADVLVAILDIDPKIDGIFGINLLAGSDALGGIFGGGGKGENHFRFAHLDFREFKDQQSATMTLDLLQSKIVTIPPGGHGDLNGDGILDSDDRNIWVQDVNHTYFGDSNLDGEFNSNDLVDIFRAGEFEDDLVKNSTWATGDWNGDCEFTTSDFVLAFRDGGFEQGPRLVQAVPEPHSSNVFLFCLWAALVLAKRK